MGRTLLSQSGSISKWIASLCQAAIAVDADKIMQLIDEIPGDRSNLAEALTELVNNYCFDQIINLTEEKRVTSNE
ncbi:MAG: hypothetical protein WBM86_28870 [Waterburya sp.]